MKQPGPSKGPLTISFLTKHVSKLYSRFSSCKPKCQTTEKATMSSMKPSRSDEIPDLDQQIKNTNQIRAGFDSLAPKRPTKPTRSEPGPFGCFSTPDPTTDHPEADKFQTLQSQTHVRFLYLTTFFSSRKRIVRIEIFWLRKYRVIFCMKEVQLLFKMSSWRQSITRISPPLISNITRFSSLFLFL